MKYASAYRVPDHDDRGFSDKSSFLIINSVGYYEFDEPYGATHRKYGRKDYYLSYNHSGKMKIKTKTGIHIIGDGDVFIYSPFEEQYYGQADDKPIANYWVHFTGYGAYEVLASANMSESNIIHSGAKESIVELFEKIITEVTEKRTGFELFSASLLMQIIALITRENKSLDEQGFSSSNKRILETIPYINKNYDRKISVSELALKCHLSTNRFSTLFKQYTGISPQQYIIDLRLRKASELIRHTSLNLRQIAALVGFEDQLYFSRLFKKYNNITPSQYQQEVRKGDAIVYSNSEAK